MGTKKILMIDDEVNLCKIIKSNLETMGDFDVDFAIRGIEGIELAKKVRPDLIILDLRMPGMDGFEVLKALKEDAGTMAIPVVMLTALNEEVKKVKAYELYSEDYLAKPIEAQALMTKIEEVLNRRGGSK